MILVINLGLKSVRAIIFDYDGRRIATSARRVNSRLFGDWVEQDAGEWTDKMVEVVNEAMDSAGNRTALRYVTVSCSSSCLVPVDSSMRPTSRVIMVSDKRAVAEGELISNNAEFQELAARNGYSASQYSQMARILWLKNNDPEAFARTDKFLAPNDFLVGLLTDGLAVTDSLNAEKFFYDNDADCYPAHLYEAFGLSVDTLPRRVAIGENIGPMATSVAERLGIGNTPEVVVGTYDAICSVFGTGVAAPGQICDVSGTVTSVRMYSDKPFRDPLKRVMDQHFPPTDGHLIGGSNNLGGGLIEWAKTCLYRESANPYEVIQSESVNENASAGATRSGIVFLPHLLGARAPSWKADARGVFFGLERHHDRGDLMRAIFESIGFSIRDFVEIFREIGTVPEMITASGGLAQISIANEIKATITGLPYHFMDEFESTSLGAAIIVMCASGVFPSYIDACRETVATRQIFLPRSQDQAYYEDMYGLYRELTDAVDPLYAKRQQIIARHGTSFADYIENL